MKPLFQRLSQFILVAVLITALISVSPVLAQDGSPPLFDDPSQAASPYLPPDPELIRARNVQVNFDLLNQAATALQNTPTTPFTVTLNLFTDTTFTATLSKASVDNNGVVVVSGTVTDQPGSEVSLAFKDDSLAGTLNVAGSFYRLRMLDSAQITLEQFNPANLNPDSVPPTPPRTAYNLQADGLVGDDDGTLLDVLVVYTPSARNAAGGTSAITSEIANAINLANSSYNNSQINTQMQLVSTAEVSYTESSFAYEDNLDHLTYNNDGYMDNVHSLRDTYKADLVVLIRESGSYCGIAWMLQQGAESYFDQYAFAVVSRGCLPGYTLAHETGHNLGAHHDVQVTNGTTGYYSYSYGYINTNGNFRTIMSYPTYCSSCTRINYWSNPNVSYNGNPTGTSNADNARTLNSTRTIVARFRDGPPPAVPGSVNGSALTKTAIQVTWSDNSNNEAGFRVERAASGSSTWTQIGGTATNQTSYTDNGLTCGTSYRYRVKSYNGNGTSAASAEKTLTTQSCLVAPGSLTATPLSSTSIRLNWTDTNSTETGYRVERAPQGGSTWSVLSTTAANAITYTDSTAACGTAYQYRVIAVEGSNNESTPSNTATATSGLCAPGSLSGTALSQQRVRITWSDTNSLEGGYRVERSPNGSSWTTLANLAANTVQYEDSGLTCGTTYYYRVSAFASGLISSPTAQVTRATNPCGVPPAPQGGSGKGFSLNAVQLQWTDVLDDETGYRIERSPNGNNGWVAVGTTGQNETTFVDNNLQNGVTYYYHIIATNSYGSSSPSSTFSARPHQKGFYLGGF